MSALADDINFMRCLLEGSAIKVHYGKQFQKNLKKVLRNPIAAKKLPAILSEIEKTGRSTIGGTHTIRNAPNFNSDLTGKLEYNWIVVPVSMKDDIRVMFKFFPELNAVEIRGVGRADEIGYKH